MGEEEEDFLDSVKAVLGMSTERCEELVKEARLLRVSMLVEQVFERSTVSSDGVRMILNAADELGVDLADDAQIPAWRLERMVRSNWIRGFINASFICACTP